MPVTRGKKRPFICGHRGLGACCRRCLTADFKLQEAKITKDEKKAAALKEEAAALKKVPSKTVSLSM